MNNKKRIGYEVLTLASLIRHELDRISLDNKLDGLTGPNSRIIRFLYANREKNIFQRDIEEAFMIRRSTVSSNLQLLEKKGYIQREPVAYDARLKKINLTEKALLAHAIIAKDTAKLQNRLAENLSKDELDSFFTVIAKLKNTLE